MLNKVQNNESDDILRRKALISAVFKEDLIPYLQIQQDGKITLNPQANNYSLSQNDCIFLSRELNKLVEYSFNSNLLNQQNHEYLLRVNLENNTLNPIFKDYELFSNTDSDIYHIKEIIKNAFNPQNKHQYAFLDLDYSINENFSVKRVMKLSCYSNSEFYLLLENIEEPLKDILFINELLKNLNDFVGIDFSDNIYQTGGFAYINSVIKSIKY